MFTDVNESNVQTVPETRRKGWNPWPGEEKKQARITSTSTRFTVPPSWGGRVDYGSATEGGEFLAPTLGNITQGKLIERDFLRKLFDAIQLPSMAAIHE